MHKGIQAPEAHVLDAEWQVNVPDLFAHLREEVEADRSQSKAEENARVGRLVAVRRELKKAEQRTKESKALNQKAN